MIVEIKAENSLQAGMAETGTATVSEKIIIEGTNHPNMTQLIICHIGHITVALKYLRKTAPQLLVYHAK